jgi:cytochrome c oxidase cbb3-type subunit 2
MPGFPWLAGNRIESEITPRKMQALRRVGVPYTDEDIKAAPAAVQGYTEMDALVAYLQSLGRASRTWK